MGVFNDVMSLVDLGERALLKGEGAKVKQEMVQGIRQAKRDAAERVGAPPEEERAPCDKAPAGYRCLGNHDEKGRCVDLEVLLG